MDYENLIAKLRTVVNLYACHAPGCRKGYRTEDDVIANHPCSCGLDEICRELGVREIHAKNI